MISTKNALRSAVTRFAVPRVPVGPLVAERGIETERTHTPARVQADGVAILVICRVPWACARHAERARGAAHRPWRAQNSRSCARDGTDGADVDEVAPRRCLRDAVSVPPRVQGLDV